MTNILNTNMNIFNIKMNIKMGVRIKESSLVFLLVLYFKLAQEYLKEKQKLNNCCNSS